MIILCFNTTEVLCSVKGSSKLTASMKSKAREKTIHIQSLQIRTSSSSRHEKYIHIRLFYLSGRSGRVPRFFSLTKGMNIN